MFVNVYECYWWLAVSFRASATDQTTLMISGAYISNENKYIK